MKFITGFFMAWGCFSRIPCPYKKWDEEARDYMLTCLPLIGLIHGVVLWGLYLALHQWLQIPNLLTAVLLALAIPGLAGFIHVDGYMDCCDAIFSQRDLAERQRILKDSSVGAFAVIGLVALFMIQAAAMYVAIDRVELAPVLIMIPVISRALSAEAVFSKRPLTHSQYNRNGGELDPLKKKSRALAQSIMTIIVILLILAFFAIFDRANILKLVTNYDIILVAELIAHLIACGAARKNLGGMSGDISGFAITISEAVAVLAMALV